MNLGVRLLLTMTAQIPDTLKNDHPRVALDGLHLYGVIRGDIRENHGWGEEYVFSNRPQPPEDAIISSALWRGYIATYQLTSSGEVELLEYAYPISDREYRRQPVRELAFGDFWLVMRSAFFEPRTYIPFRDGKIVEDPSTWIHEIDDRPSWLKKLAR